MFVRDDTILILNKLLISGLATLYSMLDSGVYLLYALVLVVSAVLVAVLVKCRCVLPAVLGFGGWILAVLITSPLRYLVVVALREDILLFALSAALIAAFSEEPIRLFMLRYLKPKAADIAVPISLGLAWSLSEILAVLPRALFTPQLSMYFFVERMSATVIHVSLSVIAARAVKETPLLIVAVATHFYIDFVAVYLARVTSLFHAELFVALAAALTALAAYAIYKEEIQYITANIKLL